MASKARQSVFGGFFGLSLNFVILPFFMRLRPSCGDDAGRVGPHCISDEEHSSVDETDSVEAQLATGVEIIKLDHMRVQEHSRSRSEVDTVLLPVGLFLGGIPFEAHASNSIVLIFSTLDKADEAAHARTREYEAACD